MAAEDGETVSNMKIADDVGTVTVCNTVTDNQADGATNTNSATDNGSLCSAPGLMVHTTDGSVYLAHLFVAADGVDSAVRKALAAAAPDSTPARSAGCTKR
jgi:2-polyprenyl-6-methoxyphenol hydroxylase-like FAD-dependent oxidoreductase